MYRRGSTSIVRGPQNPRSKKVTVLESNRQDTKLVVVVTDPEEAKKLEKLYKVKIGFLTCSIRKRSMVTRPYGQQLHSSG